MQLTDKIDLRSSIGMTTGMELCIYVGSQPSRITAHQFPVWIPSLMGDIPSDGAEASEESFDNKILLNEDNFCPTSIKKAYYIMAENYTCHTHRLDGWIPKFKIDQLTAQSGSYKEGNFDKTGSETEPGGPGPHTHAIKKPMQVKNASMNEIVFNQLVATTSTEVDFQELNNKYISYGTKMIGCFVSGEQTKFVIIGIENAIPRLDQAERGENKDNQDTSIDGDTNPPNS